MSAAVRLWVRSILRRHWRATVLLALFAGLAGGAVMAAWSYSRRAHTVVERRLEAYSAPDGGFQACPPGADPSVDLTPCFTLQGNLDAVEGLRRSTHLSALRLYAGFSVSVSRPGLPEPLRLLGAATILQDGEVAEYQVSDGRNVQPSSSTDLVVGEVNRRALGAQLGDEITVEMCGFDFFGETPVCHPATPLELVGVARIESDILPPRESPSGVENETTGFGFITTFDWWEANQVEGSAYFTTSFRLQPGSTLADVRADLPRLLPGWTTLVIPNEDITSFDGLRSATQLQGRTLLAVALVILLAAVVFVGQAFGRQVPRELAQHGTFVALGADRRSTIVVAMTRSVPIAVGASLIAVASAALASSFGPTGLASRAEVDRGFRPDGLVLATGAVLVGVLVVLATTVPAMTLARAGVAPRRRRRSPTWTARMPPAAQAGLILARSRRSGRSLVGAAIGTAAAVASVSAAASLVASLDRIESEAVLYGAAWDYGLGDYSSDEDVRDASDQVRADPMFTDATVLTSAGPIELESADAFWAVSFEPVKGSLGPVIVEGRAPSADDEIAMGRATLDDLGLELGDVLDELPVLAASDDGEGSSDAGRDEARPMLGPFSIVGVALISANDTLVGPGKGIVMTEAARSQLDPATGGQLLVRVDPALPEEEVLAALVAEHGARLTIPTPQSDIRNLGVIAGIPWVIAAMVSALALTALANALVLNVRRSRTSIAVLRTLGFTSGQVVASVAWQASAVGALSLIGVPLGVLAARRGWGAIAADIGFVAGPVVPVLVVALVGVVTIAVANSIAVATGRSAGRSRLGTVLRTE